MGAPKGNCNAAKNKAECYSKLHHTISRRGYEQLHEGGTMTKSYFGSLKTSHRSKKVAYNRWMKIGGTRKYAM